MYAVLDEQSNCSLAKTDFFDLFNIDGHSEPNTLKTCSGVMEVIGRCANSSVLSLWVVLLGSPFRLSSSAT